MEEDAFYDSLDELQNNAHSRDACCRNAIEEQPENPLNEPIEKLVPFYNGNVNKDEVDSVKNEESKKLKKKSLRITPAQHRIKRSYLTMFYERQGQNQEICGQNKTHEDPNDSNIDLMSNFSPRSFSSCDGTSCYFSDCDCEKIFENPNTLENNKLEKNGLEENKIGTGSSLFNLKPNRTSSKNISIIKRNSSDLSRIRTPKFNEFGGLGPQIEQSKVDLLRRRQSYGQMASQKNIIKMKEVKAVQNLKKEMKRSNDLNMPN